MVNESRILAEFLELVQIDSPSGSERAVAGVLTARLEKMGFSVREDGAGQSTGGAGNLIAVLPAAGGDAPLLLSAHMDTVEPGRGVHPVVTDGVVRSSGDTVLGADDKAGIAAILEAVRVVREEGITHGGLEVVFTIGEESGLWGAKQLDTSRMQSRLGFVLDGEGGPGCIVTQAPTQDKIGALVRGRAAHAGVNPQDGINAIQVAAHAIARMSLGRLEEDTTANIGVISGGKAINIVPDACNLLGETRSLDGAKRRALTDAVCRILRETAAEFGATVNISTETLYQSFVLAPSDPVVQVAVEAAGRLGFKPELVKTGGGSDANIFNQKGIPTANLGIAMQKVHTTEEYIRVADLVDSARWLVEIIRRAQA
ncbi:M20/M25/M40 family metallo-hydrolase [Desulfotomaculum copahuensis]|uniref:Peptidase M20 n=1 Tax=Desulfotomaculum copahuensis TaxID=1838280 RepID=A0A1B7LJ55_9FIRM|nr:M20/M25/M40 family metallo-hydrolase [Desulfotomaculum copahuensis]OAT86501.1 peptidase M20 [Desulfotomaculum copahuensis]